MAILDIVTYPDERLKTKAKPVTKIDDRIQTLADDMAETMYAAPGVGLAANQVGVLERIVVVDAEYPDADPNLLVLINPEILERRGTITWEEGCLSFPEVLEEIERSEWIRVAAHNKEGKAFEMEAQGLPAVVIQHEIDHLEGVTLIDRVSFLKKRMIHRQLTKPQKSD